MNTKIKLFAASLCLLSTSLYAWYPSGFTNNQSKEIYISDAQNIEQNELQNTISSMTQSNDTNATLNSAVNTKSSGNSIGCCNYGTLYDNGHNQWTCAPTHCNHDYA